MTVTAAVLMVRDEADVIGSTVAHLLTQVDVIVIADNLSTDDTRPILDAAQKAEPDRVLVIDDDEPGYYQSQKISHLANVARREFGADWITPVDADEFWYSPFGRISDVLEGVAPQWLVVPAVVYDHMVTSEDDLNQADPFQRMEWRRTERLPLPKVACRWRDDLVIQQGNHSASYDGRATMFDELLVVRHFPYRSLSQFTRKVRNGAAAYAAAGERLPESYGAHWRQWGLLSDEQLADVFQEWYVHDIPWNPKVTSDGTLLPALVFDPVHQLNQARETP